VNIKTPIPRRSFLKGSAGGVAAAAVLPTILPTRLRAQENPKPKPRGQKVRIGSIGTGNLGCRHHIKRVMLSQEEIKDRVKIVAVCDVDQNHRNEAAQAVYDAYGKRPGVYEDFRNLLDRRDIDACVVVTPDHWHALCATAVMQAGKDIYCEKPLTLFIDEGKVMVKAARQYGTVFQTGSMQRSNVRFRKACELVRNGKIGTLKKIVTHIGGIGAGEWRPVDTPPPELNWNFWLGSAPYRDYIPGHVHYQFRWFLDFSGGKMTDWGAHHNDIAQWALGMDHSGPVKVVGEGKFHEEGPYDVPGEFVVHYTYPNGVELECRSDGKNGVNFYSEEGVELFVSRSDLTCSDPSILETELGPNDVRLYNTGDHPNSWVNHYTNWLDCIETRKRPICDVEIGHRSVTVCHLGNIAIQLGRELHWDPVTEMFVDDDEANAMMSRPRRAPWHL
jgi:predicted dehydrogenase